MEQQYIIIRGAKEHNLKNIDLELPKNKLIVFTGVSGSGKSSLAFDTLYAEGQRRYIESLSNYARQFLGQLPRPNVESISGLSPTIAIQQKTASRNPRSTVGTITEISDFLRVLYARLGQGHCPRCHRPIAAQTREQIISQILAIPSQSRYCILAPLARNQKGEFKDLFNDLVKRGFVRARVDGIIVRITEDLKLDKKLKHNIELVVDRLQSKPEDSSLRIRIAEAVEQALAIGNGTLIIALEAALSGQDSETHRTSQDIVLSSQFACNHCQTSFEPPTPQLFSFNNPQGMCLGCDGLGEQYTFAEDLLVPDDSLSLYEGAIPLIGAIKSMGRWKKHIYEGVARTLQLDLKQPWKTLSSHHKKLWLDGSGDAHIVWEWKSRGNKVWKHCGKWEGIVPQLMSQFKKTAPGPRRTQLQKYMRVQTCPICRGERLNPQARAVRVNNLSLVELNRRPIGELESWFQDLQCQLKPSELLIARELLKEIQSRLRFLLNVGLHYLSLDRAAPTLSGGEAQRIRLASQIGSGLVGVLYILDEPSIGLHPHDNEKLLQSLLHLRDIGNTVIVVEHDEETMRAADYLVDFGPGPGTRGGEIVAAGTPEQVLANPKSITAKYLTGAERVVQKRKRRQGNGHAIRVVGARQNNLKNVTVDFPLGKLICVTGVSGSGKSTLVNEILKNGLIKLLGNQSHHDDDTVTSTDYTVGIHDRIEGYEYIDKIIDIDQAPIGRTPRSNPATYTKIWDEIRQLYSQMPEAKLRGYSPSRFSFNVTGGRCEACQGNGSTKLEMDFLADIWLECPVCHGRRFTNETVQVKYRGLSIHDVLELEVAQSLQHFEHQPKIVQMLQTLHDVGLDYMKLGQPSPTLSGGEAQRVKLAKELCRRATDRTLYVLDEPTTGLHFADIQKLLQVIQGFVDRGNTVVVIEHNLDVMMAADWIIDLGPGGGNGGGHIIACGTPEQIAQHKHSATGKALRKHWQSSPDRAVHAPAKQSADRLKVNSSELRAIEILGACQHNLKNVSARIPRNQMTVFCGPSGSGKTSLALDTIYAEGQRRYVESLSSYARQFLGQVQKPKFEQITGLSPAIAIEQKTTSKSPRSTVGTITEIYDYLRVLYARLGQRYCPQCQLPIGAQSTDQIVQRIVNLPQGTIIYILAPLTRKPSEKYDSLFQQVRQAGFIRVRIDGRSYNLDEVPSLNPRRKHQIEVVVDRNIVKPSTVSRISEAVEQALILGNGILHIAQVSDDDEPIWHVDRYSNQLACMNCGIGYEPLNPHHYSFNSSLGWCHTCEGLGVQKGAKHDLLVGNRHTTLRSGAITAWPRIEHHCQFEPFAQAIASHGGFQLENPIDQLSAAQLSIIIEGTGETLLVNKSTGHQFQYRGIAPAIDEAIRLSFVYRMKLGHLVDEVPCLACHGARLRSEAASTRFHQYTLPELCRLTLQDLWAFFSSITFSETDQHIAGEVLREIRNRLSFLLEVGLEYLTLDRPGPTLSGGESQRIRLASQIGSGLNGVLYVLDEPTIGLHPRDNARLLRAIQQLKSLGNTLVLVEHDRDVISSADYLLDFGPGAGDQGGEITARGTSLQLQNNPASLTGSYVASRTSIPIPTNRRLPSYQSIRSEMNIEELQELKPNNPCLSILGARHHNLKNINVHLPLGCFIAITGVSGSGKSSLVHDVLFNTLARKLNRSQTAGAAHDEITGIEHLDKVINVDQAPLGSSPSSNPATYTGVLDLIRDLYARLPESKVRGYHPRRFSFNQKGGRCEDCEGHGQKLIEMHFLPDVWIECETCQGRRYNAETLLVKYKGNHIADILSMRIHHAMTVFENIPKIRSILQTLCDVGLGYMALGQPAPTMSGGESQRVKLAAELARPSTGRTLYLLDEPTTGLHFDDVKKLIAVLQRLVDLGNTVIVIEHNLDVIKSVDWIIDMGPEAGPHGGNVVAVGTPEDIVKHNGPLVSHTAEALRPILDQGPYEERPIWKPQSIPSHEDRLAYDLDNNTSLPWESDGRKWHTESRITTKGTPCRWDGRALAFVVDHLVEMGDLGDVNWNHRSIVEIPASVKSQGWILHALTGHEAYLTLCFRVQLNTFKLADLEQQLKLTPLNNIRGLESYSRDARITLSKTRQGWQEVNMTIVTLDEVTSPGFRDFLRQVHQSFLMQIQGGKAKAEFTPWKQLGKQWHLSAKGFPIGKQPKWDLNLVARLMREFEQLKEVTFSFDVRDAITIRTHGISRMWVRMRTKDADALELMLVGKPGKYNSASLDGLAADQEISTERSDGTDFIRLRWVKSAQFNAEKVRAFLIEHQQRFLELFGTR